MGHEFKQGFKAESEGYARESKAELDLRPDATLGDHVTAVGAGSGETDLAAPGCRGNRAGGLGLSAALSAET